MTEGSGNGIHVRGGFGNFMAVVVAALLAAGVAGVWDMNGKVRELANDMTWLKGAVLRNENGISSNDRRLDALERTPPR